VKFTASDDVLKETIKFAMQYFAVTDTDRKLIDEVYKENLRDILGLLAGDK
jgi:hypothetical protein